MKESKQKKSVLVVDDDADIRTQINSILQARYTVSTAASGKECLQFLAAQRPDCIVMDVMMDDVADGLETAKQIKEAPATRDIPIILLTSVNQSYDYRSQADAGYYPHNTWIDKPVKAERLLQEVAALIG
jgi:putative two-component system response regulator